mmetsp:Transcript_102255/g.181562  ORF Transcript_102255/g.181562 Transcript_102255/m.181562 type:complete len:205 (-) Transcript_102255:1816-2430(-)
MFGIQAIATQEIRAGLLANEKMEPLTIRFWIDVHDDGNVFRCSSVEWSCSFNHCRLRKKIHVAFLCVQREVGSKGTVFVTTNVDFIFKACTRHLIVKLMGHHELRTAESGEAFQAGRGFRISLRGDELSCWHSIGGYVEPLHCKASLDNFIVAGATAILQLEICEADLCTNHWPRLRGGRDRLAEASFVIHGTQPGSICCRSCC